MRRRDAGHGWWPYVAPYVLFLLIVEISTRLPEGAAARWLLPLRVALPALLIAGFAWRGAYPELRSFRPGRALLLDVAVGLGLVALWVAPFLFLEGLPRGSAFDPEVLGPERRGQILALRFAGFALVTPFLEELFVRSFLLRLVDVLWAGRGDFRDVPIGRFRWPSFLVTTVWFTLTHVPWEWIVAAPTGAILTLWLYRRRHMGAPIVAHAVTNGALFALVAFGPGDLWFFL
jgi:uncharacterized protein